MATLSHDAVLRHAAARLPTLVGDGATLRPDQGEAIAALVADRSRVLCVQRTGWGKSAVYFLATALLREAGAGPTLIVSPLLALMRDQLAAARRIGLVAETINSTNVDDWREITDRITAGDVDLLLISPERLNHPDFRRDILAELGGQVGLVVVDEAHCISDWGHDFRPDYRRIRDLIASLPANVPVLATTATANLRVTADVAEQLGEHPVTLRGSLDRESLVLDVRKVGASASRMAWVADWLPTVDGSGIVYCLTVADAERLARFLAEQGFAAEAYTGKADAEERERIEEAFGAGDLKVVVATTALSMGYDKADVAFVVHYGLPASPVAYYQAIGRAGRSLERAWVVALPGHQDEAVWQYFTDQASPPPAQVAEVLSTLGELDPPVSLPRLEQHVNLRRSRLELILKVADVEGAVERVRGGWQLTGQGWTPDPDRVARLRAARSAEAEAMRAYADSSTCLTARLRAELDDLSGDPADPRHACGRCSRCTGVRIGPDEPDPATVELAQRVLRGEETEVPPRKQWPSGVPGRKGKLAAPHPGGRALALGADHGWDRPLSVLLDGGGDPSSGDAPAEVKAAFEEVVAGLARTLAAWDWPQRPTWVATVPSRRRPSLVTAVADHLAALGRMGRADPLVRAEDTPPQRSLANSAQQAAAADRAWAPITGSLPDGPVLLVDDLTHSGWTFAVAAERLAAAGAPLVLPLALLRQP